MQPLRVQVQPLHVIAQFIRPFIDLYGGVVQQVKDLVQGGIQALQLAQFPQGMSQPAVQGFIVFVQHLQHGLAGLQQAAAVGKAFVFVLQGVKFTVFGRQRLQFLDLVLQQFQARVVVAAVVSQPGQRHRRLLPVPPCFAYRPRQVVVTGIGVQ